MNEASKEMKEIVEDSDSLVPELDNESGKEMYSFLSQYLNCLKRGIASSST